MRAIVNMYYIRPSRRKAWVGTEKIFAKENEIVNKVNDFILERVNKENYLPVIKFSVKLYRNSYNETPCKVWEYSPTNRKGYIIAEDGVSCPVLDPNKAFATHSDAYFWATRLGGLKSPKISSVIMDGDWMPIDQEGNVVKNPFLK